MSIQLLSHEDFDELCERVKKWDRLFQENSDLIFLGKDFKDIEKAKSEKKTAIFLVSNCSL